MIDRRTFLRRLLLTTPAVSLGMDLDWEKLLWLPKSMIVVPHMPTIFTPRYYEVAVPVYVEDLRLITNTSLGNVVSDEYRRIAISMATWMGHTG